jgi:hypothetical protein
MEKAAETIALHIPSILMYKVRKYKLKNKVKILSEYLFVLLFTFSCSNKSSPPPTPTPKSITVKNTWLNAAPFDNTIYGTNLQPIIKVEFTEPVKPSSITSSLRSTILVEEKFLLQQLFKITIQYC